MPKAGHTWQRQFAVTGKGVRQTVAAAQRKPLGKLSATSL
jgi:hypothetical protein